MSRRRLGHFTDGQAYYFWPLAKGVWIRTHPCVAYVACPFGDCLAGVDQACRGANGRPTAGTHIARRDAYDRMREDEGRR